MRAKRVAESVNFERGQDPKRSMGIGKHSLQKDFTEYYDDMLDYFVDNLHILIGMKLKNSLQNGSISSKNFAKVKEIIKDYLEYCTFDEYYLDTEVTFNDLVERLRFSVNESIRFERGKDPKKALGIGRVRPYPDMTVDQFQRWFREEILPYVDDDGEQAIVDNLLMNDWESDLEVSKYLMARISDIGLIDELIRMRGYFNDREYIKRLFKEDLF